MSATQQKRLAVTDYMVGWLCPLPIEQLAATIMLDEIHEKLPQPSTDHNVYTLGSVHGHNVVIASLPSTGNTSAAVVATQMRTTFSSIKFGLLVGIGGAVPVTSDEGPIRLGHVVVSLPVGAESGAVQYDHGKAEVGHFKRTGSIPAPPPVLLNAAQKLSVDRASHEVDPLVSNLRRIKPIRGHRKLHWPGSGKDILFAPDYLHNGAPKIDCVEAGCDQHHVVDRSERDDLDDAGQLEFLVVHRGTVACGEMVIKDGTMRDNFATRGDGILCFEMEAAGALNDFPCLVIRGISDYCDSHKNDVWHGFAAVAAASYARHLFNYFPIEDVQSCTVSRQDLSYVKAITLENEIVSWLSPPDASSSYHSAHQKQFEGTGIWLKDRASYAEWTTKPGSFLWITGKPGAGKTVLSSIVVDDRKQNLQGSQAMAYFYLEHTDSAKQALMDLLKSVVIQMCSPPGSKRWSELVAYYEGSKSKQTHSKIEPPSLSGLKGLFQNLVTDPNVSGGVYVVIDALDESARHSKSRSELLSWLNELAFKRYESLHIFITSRPEEDLLERLLSVKADERLDMQDGAANQQDISSYVHHILYEHPDWRVCRSNSVLLSEIETTLLRKADGMFRWVDCQLKTLQTCESEYDLNHALETLPRDLDETYDRMILGIDQAHYERAVMLLQFLLLIERPLRLTEANNIVAIDLAQNRYDSSRRFFLERRVLNLCPGLIAFRDVVSKGSLKVQELLFAHFSVKEYLLSSRLSPGFRHHFEWQHLKASVVCACLSSLLTADQTTTQNDPHEMVSWLKAAHEIWAAHAGSAEEFSEKVYNLTAELFASRSFDFIIRQTERHAAETLILGPASRSIYRRRCAVKSAAQNGMMKQLKRLLESETPDHVLKQSRALAPIMCPLSAAVVAGQGPIVDLLLASGAHPHGQRYLGSPTLIKEALDANHAKIVTSLLAVGVTAGAHDPINLLVSAASTGNTDSTRAILRHFDDGSSMPVGFSFLTAGDLCKTLMHTITPCIGHLLVEAILQRSVSDRDNGFRLNDCLAHAARFLDAEDFLLLFDAGARADSIEALEAVSSGWTGIEVFRLVLRACARFDAATIAGSDALLKAARSNAECSLEIMKALLAAGAGATKPDARALDHVIEEAKQAKLDFLLGQSTIRIQGHHLLQAAQIGNGQLVRVFLERGVDSNCSDHNGRTPLHRAAEHNHSSRKTWHEVGVGSCQQRAEIVTLLLEYGADANATDDYGYSPLGHASLFGCLPLVELFHKAGSHINLSNPVNGSALFNSARGASLSCLEFLLESGADTSFKDWDEYILSAVVEPRESLSRDGRLSNYLSRRSKPIAQMLQALLSAGAPLNPPANGSTAPPLLSAIGLADCNVVGMLLDAGACADARDSRGRNVLHLVAKLPVLGTEFECIKDAEVENMMRLLIERGADVNAKEYTQQQRPLHKCTSMLNVAAAKVLLEHGADPNAGDCDGLTPLHCLSIGFYGNELVAAQYDTPVVAMIELLKRYGADINAAAASGTTPLHESARDGSRHAKITKALLTAGADPNLAPDKKFTALTSAVRIGHADKVRLLLDHGAHPDPAGKDSSIFNCFLVSNYRTEDMESIARMLLHFGAAYHPIAYEILESDEEVSNEELSDAEESDEDVLNEVVLNEKVSNREQPVEEYSGQESSGEEDSRISRRGVKRRRLT